MVTATISFIIALMVGGGATIVAESALPGDAFYPIKTNVNEEVRGALALSSKAQADWEARRAERRLEEAGRLALQNRLSAETRADIETRFNAHVEAFEGLAAKIEQNRGSGAIVAQMESDFQAALGAYEKGLAQLEIDEPELQPILTRVRAKLNAMGQSNFKLHIPEEEKQNTINVESETQTEASQEQLELKNEETLEINL